LSVFGVLFERSSQLLLYFIAASSASMRQA